MIRANQLCRRYGSRVVVRDLSFEVGASEIVALLGPNGAGKTTTLRMLAGLIAPTSGQVFIAGTQLSRHNASGLRRRIGFLTEMPGLWDRLTLRENLAVYAGFYDLRDGDEVIDGLLDRFNLTRHARARAAELSKGMRQKAAIARALLHRPDILLLDEPTSGLDPETTRSVRRLLEERRAAGCAVIVSTHNLDEAERVSDRVAVLQEHLIAFDTAASLRRRLPRTRVVARVAGPSVTYVSAVRNLDAGAVAEDDLLTLTLADADRDTPELVRTLVGAGADLLEIRPEVPALEDVYLHLLGQAPRTTGRPA